MKHVSFYLTLIAIFICISFANAQVTFEKYFGGPWHEYGCFVAQTGDSGYIVTGGSSDLSYAVRTDINGNIYWTQTYDIGPGYQTSLSGAYTADNGCVIIGTVDWFSRSNDVLLIKANYSGSLQWVETYGHEYFTEWGYSVAQTFDGGYIIAGYAYTQTGSIDVYLIKTQHYGWQIWSKFIGGAGGDVGYSVLQTFDSCYVIAGETSSYGAGGDDVYFIKTDQNGDTVWTRTFGGYYNEIGKSIAQTTDDGYVIAGRTSSYGAGSDDVYLIKTDENGNAVWIRTFGGAYGDYGNSVAQTTDGGYIIAGTTESFGAGASDVYLIKTDQNGDTVWTRTFGGINSDYGNSVAQTTDGGYIIAGTTESFGAGASDVYLIKTDENGNVGINEKHKDHRCIISDTNFYSSPNPFRDNTSIFYSVSKPCHVTVKIYNVYGKCIKILCDNWKNVGAYILMWDGCDNTNRKISAGLYYIVIEDNNHMNIEKVIFIR